MGPASAGATVFVCRILGHACAHLKELHLREGLEGWSGRQHDEKTVSRSSAVWAGSLCGCLCGPLLAEPQRVSFPVENAPPTLTISMIQMRVLSLRGTNSLVVHFASRSGDAVAMDRLNGLFPSRNVVSFDAVSLPLLLALRLVFCCKVFGMLTAQQSGVVYRLW